MAFVHDELSNFARRRQHARRDALRAPDLEKRFSPTAIFPTTTGTAAAGGPPTNDPTSPTTTNNPPPTTTDGGSPTTPPPPPPPPPTTTSNNPAPPPTTTSTTPTTTSTSTSTTPSSTSTSTTPSLVLPAATTNPLATLPTATHPLVTAPGVGGTSTVPGFGPTLDNSAPSATNTGTSKSSSGLGAGAAVGIACAAIGGVVVIAAVVAFVLRRMRRSRDDEFDASSFRRQSAVLADEGSLHGGRPRPPSMIERHYAGLTTAVPPSQQAFAAPPRGYGATGPFADYSHPYAANPGAQVQYAEANYYNPNSPTGSPVPVGAYNSAYDDHGRLVRTPSNGAAHMLNPMSPPPHEGQYADLSRESVTPFQAAQYAAISAQLGVEPPHAHQATVVSPFEDDIGGSSVDHHHQAHAITVDDDLQPARPSSQFDPPVGRERVTSIPPMLPEIRIAESPAATQTVHHTETHAPELKRPESLYTNEDAYGEF